MTIVIVKYNCSILEAMYEEKGNLQEGSTLYVYTYEYDEYVYVCACIYVLWVLLWVCVTDSVTLVVLVE